MRLQMTLFFLLITHTICYTQDINYKSYSFSEFFQMMEAEDSLFMLQDAFIEFDSITDAQYKVFVNDFYEVSSDTLQTKRIIKAEIQLKNIHFLNLNKYYPEISNMEIFGIFRDFIFRQRVQLINCSYIKFFNCDFKDQLVIRLDKEISASLKDIETSGRTKPDGTTPFAISHCLLEDNVDIQMNFYRGEIIPFGLSINHNRFQLGKTDTLSPSRINDKEISVFCRMMFMLEINNNKFYGNGVVEITDISTQVFSFSNNKILDALSILKCGEMRGFNRVEIFGNSFGKTVMSRLEALIPSYQIHWGQFAEKMLSYDGYLNYYYDKEYSNSLSTYENKLVNRYRDSIIVVDESSYKEENALKGILLNHYNSKLDKEDANQVFVEFKDLQTRRYHYLYQQNPNFNTFFKFKINQFLKIFSSYGTEPTRAIVLSVYVIFFFALIYLFFPNSWDKHGKNRIVDRYSFFLKYMNSKAGIHEVYLEEKEAELLAYNKFKDFIHSSEHKVPRFFTATALPLYKWAISGTIFTSRILKKVDIMKGSWSELPAQNRLWKSILLISAFSIAILYDLTIKMLNALMLSINTFTTLGFGEIPIRGLPRYLAIIQGFIGWFMLTIFSVSLISQLLN